MADSLARLGITTVQELLFHLPNRYQDRTRLVPIGSLRHGDEASIEAEVIATSIQYSRRRMLVSRVSDNTGILTLRFFHFSASQQENLSPGTGIQCYGEVRNVKGSLEMIHPEYRTKSVSKHNDAEPCLTAVYSTTEGLRQFSIRNLIDQLIPGPGQINVDIPEWLPTDVLETLQYPPLADAIAYVHKPPPDVSIDLLRQTRHVCQQRLIFEELLAHYLAVRQLRLRYQVHKAPALSGGDALQKKLIENLPFQLTGAQRKVLGEINGDLSTSRPMLRLVQGDVGSGKTIIAALALLQAVDSGFQVALMAPTELLAYQHYQNLNSWLMPLGIDVEWFTGKIKGKTRKQLLEKLSEGQIQVIVGTHALFQEEVEFQKLAMIIIDEQHRFGVHQRLALRNKGKLNFSHDASLNEELYPHQLVMTATPIPRTLAMTAYADLDCSVIDELPPGRIPIETVVLEERRREEVINRVYEACLSGKQAYWVCTLIEESEALQCQAAEDTAVQLHNDLPDIRIGLVHGRMKAADKDQVMEDFKSGKIDLLVATTVIEVGVNVPNATLMIIENAERLGLAQLHQLRGRVGRGSHKSACVLLYRAPLSQLAKQRLAIMRSTNDGFEIAQQDLEIRGPGEFIGTRQTGLVQFRIADPLRDQFLLPKVIQVANIIMSKHPENVQRIIDRWIVNKEDYGNV